MNIHNEQPPITPSSELPASIKEAPLPESMTMQEVAGEVSDRIAAVVELRAAALSIVPENTRKAA